MEVSATGQQSWSLDTADHRDDGRGLEAGGNIVLWEWDVKLSVMFLVHIQVCYLDERPHVHTHGISGGLCSNCTEGKETQRDTERREEVTKWHKYANAYRRVRLELHQTGKPRSAELEVNPNRRGRPSLVVSCRSAHRLQRPDCRLSLCCIRILRWHFSEHDDAWNWSCAARGCGVCGLNAGNVSALGWVDNRDALRWD